MQLKCEGLAKHSRGEKKILRLQKVAGENNVREICKRY